jgi:CheY-like chemotaxis protein
MLHFYITYDEPHHMAGKIAIALVDDQKDQRDRNLYSMLHAGEEHGLPGIRFCDVDVRAFLTHEDQPFSQPDEQLMEMPEFLIPGGDYKSNAGYLLDPSSPYVLRVGWDGSDAIAFAQEGIDLLVINRHMDNVDGHRAVAAIRERGIKVPIIIVTSDDEGQLMQFSPPVYTQAYGGNEPNVDGYVCKQHGLFRRIDSLGVQVLSLLHPAAYGHLRELHEEKFGPIYAPNIEEVVRNAELNKRSMPFYYMR